MNQILIAGIGTGVGKTIVSAIITKMLQGDYWKPIESGSDEDSDTVTVRELLKGTESRIFEPAYTFSHPLSPHHAARLENRTIVPDKIRIPKTDKTLVIEGVGGIYVPLSTEITTMDLFDTWNCQWIIVSRHYLGSINHTLLTVEAARRRQLSIAGIVFNGMPNPDSEEAILNMTHLPKIGRLLPEEKIDSSTLSKYAQQWKHQWTQLHQS